jgi:hypothetical protein
MVVSVAFGQSSPSRVPKIVVESSLERPDHQTTAEELNRKLRSFECDPNTANGSRRFNSPLSVGESLGEPVNAIRVIGFAPKSSRQKLSQLGETVLGVWNGKFQSSACFIPWAEVTFWSIEARLEFANGKRGLLITDGMHVALREPDGTTSFFRLLPAAQ